MKRNILSSAHLCLALSAAALSASAVALPLMAQSAQSATQPQPSTVSLIARSEGRSFTFRMPDARTLTIDFYGENIVRLFADSVGKSVRNPQATPAADILVSDARRAVQSVRLEETADGYLLQSAALRFTLHRDGTFALDDLARQRQVLRSTTPLQIEAKSTRLTLACAPDEYFYGGGVQNGRFSHRGQRIAIENTNNWVDGGVASPTPFYWSTAGYGVLWHSFKPGSYDFGASKAGEVRLEHKENYADLFLMVDQEPTALLRDFYQLTGHPVLLPKFGFYQGHLNAYNRDYWTPDTTGRGFMAFEDGKRYNESQKDNGGIKESLNGEHNNYQFSARAAIDRYVNNDMPLGWFLPNDGYGAGYGQTSTLDGNIENLRQFGQYARSKGVEIGLWTQSDLHPKDGIEALLQRDIVKEVGQAGVRVLKTDVAWVGWGYSFGLNGCADVAQIMPKYGQNARPFIISLDGWAGTQRYAGIWSGDQTGGEWEYIRFHIPTFIGSGLSGQPNISSDTDGIFGGKNPIVNIREYQWKAFNPMGLNMDGWGSSPKYPHAQGGKTTALNRWYAKFKSQIQPYTYAAAHQATSDKPLIRPMFMEEATPYTLGKRTQYQYMYGDAFLVAPIYQNTAADAEGNDRRDNIYLPHGTWVDYFTGQRYEGGCVLNYFDAPLWKLPLLVKADAIIPIAPAHNNPTQVDPTLRAFEIYAQRGTTIRTYDDDGRTQAYLDGASATAEVTTLVQGDQLTLRLGQTVGTFEGMAAQQRSLFVVNVSQSPKKVVAKAGTQRTKLRRAASRAEFDAMSEGWFYDERPQLNVWVREGEESVGECYKNPQLLVKTAAVPVASTTTEVLVSGFRFAPLSELTQQKGRLEAPRFDAAKSQAAAYTLTPAWSKVPNADYYELEFDGQRYTHLLEPQFLFDQLSPTTAYDFRLRAVNADGPSPWTSFRFSTVSDPLEWAIKSVRALTTVDNQGGQGTDKLFDHDLKTTWHTSWSNTKAIPFDMIVDLRAVHQLDRLDYVPRQDAGNGTLLSGSYQLSTDRQTWSAPTAFQWAHSADTKTLTLPQGTEARYVKFHFDKGIGGYGSGQELFVFRRPGTEGFIQGDINRDKRIDDNDLTSYMNYTGLRRGDADYDYVAIGDINRNGLIDAYDISCVAVELDEPAHAAASEQASGTLLLQPKLKSYKAGEIVEVSVVGKALQAVNALSFALPYDADELEYLSTEPKAASQMTNLTYDRLHSNGRKALYPTFVNRGQLRTLSGSEELFVLRFRAKKAGKLQLRPADGLIVDRNLGAKAVHF